MLLVLSNGLLLIYLYNLMTLNVKNSKEYSCLLCVLYHVCIWQAMDLKEKTDLLEGIKFDEMISITEISIPYIFISSKTKNEFRVTCIILSTTYLRPNYIHMVMIHRQSQEARLLQQLTLRPGLLDAVQMTSHYLYDALIVQMNSVRALTRPTSSPLQQLRAVDF